MDKLEWCTKKKGGLSLVEPSSNLAEAYIKKAEEALEAMRENISQDWKVSTSYYSIYFSLYSLLRKIGVKCEIHSCTIEFVKQFLSEFFKEDELVFVEDSFRARINTQYYVNKKIKDEQYEKMIEKTPEFLVKCKSILIRLNEKKINEIREAFGN